MCFYPFLAIELRRDMRSPGDVAAAIDLAGRHGLRVRPNERDGGPTLERFAQGTDALLALVVSHCACDWGAPEHGRMVEIARALLAARDVRRVRLGFWTEPDRGPALEVREIDTSELDGVDWRSGVALSVRRAPEPPYPTRTLAQLARDAG